jgi:hypothetical protein
MNQNLTTREHQEPQDGLEFYSSGTSESSRWMTEDTSDIGHMCRG